MSHAMKTLQDRLREQDWPEAADRIDALEGALREADGALTVAQQATEDADLCDWLGNVSVVVMKALIGEPD